MSTNSQRDKDALEHVLHALNAVIEYASVGPNRFFRDRMVQDAIIRQFEVLGESTKRLSAEFRERHADIPWNRIAGFRDILIHHYDHVDPEEVWRTILTAVPSLLQQLKRLHKRN